MTSLEIEDRLRAIMVVLDLAYDKAGRGRGKYEIAMNGLREASDELGQLISDIERERLLSGAA